MSISSIDKTYSYLSSGSMINTAADNAAGLAISQKMTSQVNGYSVATNNAEDGKNVANIAEGGLSSVNGILGRMYEIGVQASNGIYTDEDKAIMQNEIEQLKKGIVDQVKGTQFNTIKLLDSSSNINIATNANGSGMTIKTQNTTLETLGISNFDVTGDFDLSTISDAINKVSESRSTLGAYSNRLDYTINSNKNNIINTTSSLSTISDTNYGEQSTNLKTQQVLEKYKYFMLKQSNKQKANGLLSLFGE